MGAKCADCGGTAHAKDFIVERGIYLHAECVEFFQEKEARKERLEREVSDLDVVLLTACPKCDAPMGSFCRDPRGKRTSLHKKRKKLYFNSRFT